MFSNWRPTANHQALRARAELLGQIRQFFAGRSVLEVETPLLSGCGVTDPTMMQLKAINDALSHQGFLQTSPEYAMKRLLAAGSGSIFQICKAFRAGEAGTRHNPEFTLLEWYREGFNDWQLMDEVFELFALVLNISERHNYSYQQAFIEFLAIDPLTIDDVELRRLTDQRIPGLPAKLGRNDCLDLLFGKFIEPQFAAQAITFVYHYPAQQSALAMLDPEDPRVACRFEVFCGGLELGNGFRELTDAVEQRQRFTENNRLRALGGLPQIDLDERLLAALDSGLPACAGIAVGIDRLLMLQLNADSIEDVLTFPSNRA